MSDDLPRGVTVEPSEMPESTPDVTPRILIAGIGNIFLGDDGFGVAVAQHLANRRYPAGVVVADYGIRGVDLAYTLLDGCDTLALVDATPRGGAPGTLYLLELPTSERKLSRQPAPQGPSLDAHSMNPLNVLAFAYRLGARPGRVLLVGCEPTPVAEDDDTAALNMDLSAPVRAAVAEAAAMIDSLVERLIAERQAPRLAEATGARTPVGREGDNVG